MSHRGRGRAWIDDGHRGRTGNTGRGVGRAPGGRGGRYNQHIQNSSQLCIHFTWEGSCSYGDRCRYAHKLRNVATVPEAHTDKIYCIALAPSSLPGSYQLFTGGKDQTVKRWTVSPVGVSQPQAVVPEGLLPSDALEPARTGEGQSDLVFYDVKLANVTPFESPVTSILLAAECLFCGLLSGLIRGFVSATGHAFDLTGHTTEVHAMVLIDNILVTGDFKGSLIFWQPGVDNEGRPTFQSVTSMHLGSGITCMKEIMVPSPEGVVKTLWVGCVGRICVIHLPTMSISVDHALKQKPTSGPARTEVCMQLVSFNDTILAGGVSGSIYRFQSDCSMADSISAFDEVMAMDGILTQDGPCLAIGSHDGWMSFLELPSLREAYSLKAHNGNIRAVRSVIAEASASGTPPFIISVSEDQAISFWTPSSSSGRKPGSTQPPPPLARGGPRRRQ